MSGSVFRESNCERNPPFGLFDLRNKNLSFIALLRFSRRTKREIRIPH